MHTRTYTHTLTHSLTHTRTYTHTHTHSLSLSLFFSLSLTHTHTHTYRTGPTHAPSTGHSRLSCNVFCGLFTLGVSCPMHQRLSVQLEGGRERQDNTHCRSMSRTRTRASTLRLSLATQHVTLPVCRETTQIFATHRATPRRIDPHEDATQRETTLDADLSRH